MGARAVPGPLHMLYRNCKTMVALKSLYMMEMLQLGFVERRK